MGRVKKTMQLVEKSIGVSMIIMICVQRMLRI